MFLLFQATQLLIHRYSNPRELERYRAEDRRESPVVTQGVRGGCWAGRQIESPVCFPRPFCPALSSGIWE